MHEEEVTRLLFQAEKKLDAARELFDRGFYDDAVSRSYYSMYFATTALFLSRDIRIRTHKGLITRFGQEFVTKGIIEKFYGRTFRIAEELRSEADYSVSREISEEEAKTLIEDAEKFLSRLRKAIFDIEAEKEKSI